jgi:hypothetical protein
MERIEDIIEEAKAEEKAAEEKKEEKFRKELRKGLEEALKIKNEQQVSIPVSEYVALKQKERDLELIVMAIMDDLELNYDKEDLRISGGNNTVGTFKTLYNVAYTTILEDFKTKDAKGGV